MSVEGNYVFQSLQTYASDEWMANAKKRYRAVFDNNETKQIGVELSIYNTKFQEEDWDGEVELRCVRETDPKRAVFYSCEDFYLSKSENKARYYKVWKHSVEDPIIKGTYKWSAYINKELIGETTFYIQDIGAVTPVENPYFEIRDIILFKGGKELPALEDRVYLKQFNAEDTPYVWIQLDLLNEIEESWIIEVFFNFLDETGMLKEQISSFNIIEKDKKGECFIITAGWGQEKPGYWLEDNYNIKIVFMGCLIEQVNLQFGKEDIEGYVLSTIENGGSYKLSGLARAVAVPEKENQETNNLIDKLNQLIGLEEIKTKIKEFSDYVDFIKLRKEQGFEEDEDFKLHSVFTGNPGTGKTTVVKYLGQIFKQKGLLSKGHILEVDRSNLIGEYIGQTAPMTKRAIEKARGGILFIDEAYMLNRDNERDFGKEVIEVILKEMSDGPGDIAIMVAGYPDKMEKFLDTNPGLRSRFKYHYHFSDYTPDELMEIAMYATNKKGVTFTPKAKENLKKIIIEDYRNRDENFGNARYVYSVVDEAKIKLGMRVLSLPPGDVNKKSISTITTDDIQKLKEKTLPKKAHIPVNETLLKESLAELNDLKGLKEVKEEVNELVKLVRYYREMGKDVMNQFSFHTVFIGNPGTGKTTVARIIGKIYKALGILEHGHVVETDREGLVEGYVAQTAPKTKAKIEEAMDGILFIDEAYSLASESDKDGFGQEAIEVLLKNMEDKRGCFVVIVAGYPDNMYQFLESNHGLQSRFDTILQFKDYNAEELLEIALNMFNTEKMYLEEEAKHYLEKYMQHVVKLRSKNFGNAREVRKLVSEIIRNQNLRMADLPKEKRTKNTLKTIILDDVDDFVVEPIVKRQAIGFKAQRIL